MDRSEFEHAEENPIVEHLVDLGLDIHVVVRLVSQIGLPTLLNYTADELVHEGVPRKLTRRIIATFALVRLVDRGEPRQRIGMPEDSYALFRPLIAFEDQEVFVVAGIDVRNQLIGIVRVGVGSVMGVEVHPREIFRAAIRMNAASVVLGHNHPSDQSTPSPEDIQLTQRLREVGDLVGIPVTDHIVVCRSGFTSISRWIK